MFSVRSLFPLGAAALTLVTAPADAGTDPFLGEIAMVAGSYCPRGFMDANGQLMTISDYPALYSLFGDLYGGDGIETFALPDLRGRVPVGEGTGPGLSTARQGQTFGAEAKSLTLMEMPEHSHGATSTAVSTLHASSAPADLRSPEGALLAAHPEAEAYVAGIAPDVAMAEGAVETTVETSVAPVGGGEPFNLAQPSLVMRYCVAVVGFFPSRP